MAFKDLREFIEELESRGLLRRIKTEVDAELEITEITDRVSKMEGEKNVGLVMDVDTKNLCHFFVVWLNEQWFFLDKFCKVFMRDIQNQLSTTLMTKIKSSS